MSTGSDARAPRYLGAVFIFQCATSLAAGVLSGSILTGGISEVLMNISSELGQMRASIVLELLTSVGIIGMTSLLSLVLGDQNRAAALVTLGLWMAGAVMLAVKTLGMLSLGVSRRAGDIGMLVFCLGALLWCSLLLQSRIVPQLLSLRGLAGCAPGPGGQRPADLPRRCARAGP